MRLAEGIEALELSREFMGRTMSIHPVLIEDAAGLTVVDTGLPGQGEALAAAIAGAGGAVARVRRIILTHQDMDHIGNARALAEAAGGAEVCAHAADVPYIQGERPLLKADAKRMQAMLASLPEAVRQQMQAVFATPPSVHVDRVLADGETLQVGPGLQVVHTPGHTPGHISLYVPGARLLLAGDALRVEGGRLLPPAEANTPDMAQALASVRRLAALPLAAVLCYHGGLYTGADVPARLQEIGAA